MALDNILLIDDDEVANQLHQKLIQKLKLAKNIFTEKDGRDGLDFIRQRYYGFHSLPSLIILDLNMPVMDGVDFLKEICHSDLLFVNRIPIAVLTNSVHPEEDMKRITEIRNCYYISKPLTEEKLLQVIEQAFVE